MQTDPSHLIGALEHKLLGEKSSCSATQIEAQLNCIVCGQTNLQELERLFGPSEKNEVSGNLRLARWQFSYTEQGLHSSDPQVLTVALDGNNCITNFALV